MRLSPFSRARDASHPAPADSISSREYRLVQQFEQARTGWFWETGPDGLLSYLSGHVSTLIGKPVDELIGGKISEIVQADQPDDCSTSRRSLSFYLSSRVPFKDLVVRANTADEVWWSISGTPRADAYGNFIGFSGIAADLTSQRRAEVELNRLARFDSLTGLDNRDSMRRTLENLLSSASPRHDRCAVFLLDLDRFKGVNDTWGHPVGDALLRLAAHRLKEQVGDQGQVGRIGGDEFQIILPRIAEPSVATELAKKIISELSKPYYVEGKALDIGASIGIVLSDYDERTGEDLVRDADIALYAAKAAGKGTYRVFTTDMTNEALERQVLESDLRTALANDQLQVLYQPCIQLSTEQVCGFEALIRWVHPQKGTISPSVFIPLAEEIGLIGPIGEYVLRTACAAAAAWPPQIKIAVNLSPLQFANLSLPSVIENAISAAGLPAARLELEITEGVLLDGLAPTKRMIGAIQALGSGLVIDDFGTGFSSLSYLKDNSFTKIKIDQSFVRGAAEGHDNSAAIIRSIVGLASELGMDTTAEGVETHDDLALVRALGCTLVQGFIYGKPVPAAEALELAWGGKVRKAGFLRHRAPRLRLLKAALLTSDAGTWSARLRNISGGGALVECAQPFEVGTRLKLDISAGAPLEASIVWNRGKQIGLKFDSEFDLSTLSPPSAQSQVPKMMTPEFLANVDHPHSPTSVVKARLLAKDLRCGRV